MAQAVWQHGPYRDQALQGSGEREPALTQDRVPHCNVNNNDSRKENRHRVSRTGWATLLFAVLRPRQAKAATVNGNELQLEYGFRSLEISLGKIKSAELKTGWFWSRIRLCYDRKEAVVSGLSPKDTRAFVKTLKVARVHWWRRTLASQIEILQSVYDRLTQLEDPLAYLRLCTFNALRHDAQSIAGQFTANWPSTLSDTPEIQRLRTILDFLQNPEHFRAKTNATFIANELDQSKELFDRIEKRPLTEEQRKAVVVDDDRNLVIAAAGSGKTSVIAAKAGWLLQRGYRRPSELLLLAFARDAKKEMEERISKRLGEDAAQDITVSTFHSLGLKIIGEVEGQRPAIAKVAQDDRAFTHLLKTIVSDLIADDKISETVLAWFKEQFAPYRSPHEFKTWGAYYDYIRRYEIRSLKGEQVKSFEECEIANFLYLNGIDYEYERLYEHETSTSEKGPYRPDFYLPGPDIWIEHFGINAEGKTAPYIPQEEYLEQMAWKKALHQAQGTTLFETFSHECAAGTLLRNLEKKLLANDVLLSPLPSSDAFTALEEQGWIDPFIRLVATFLQHFKTVQLSFEQVMQRAATMKDRARAEAFLAVFKPIIERYQAMLEQSGEIDFHDMIVRAAAHVEAGRYQSPFGYVLVDEFQDISLDRARLLKALLERKQSTQLFAVGDDWQAIFRFAGSDISIIREFSRHFGEGERLSLETTFRCVDRIAKVATEFILRNPTQISKTVRSIYNAEGPRVHVGLSGEQKLSLLKEALDRIAEDSTRYDEPSSVLLLGRYNHLRPQNLSSLKKQYLGLQFTYKTVHGSKGLEADYVIVLGLCVAKYGFPTEIADDPLLDLMLGTPEAHPNAEERRLMYVAITRARRHTYLLANGGPPSSFVTELTGDDYDITVFGRLPERDVSCPLCVEGRLLRRENKKNGSIFYSCSNFPYCEHQQQPCPVCREGLLIKDQEEFKCRDCGQSIEACPECGGWLQVRLGRYGRFLGCTSYPSCKYTRKIQLEGKKNKGNFKKTSS